MKKDKRILNVIAYIGLFLFVVLLFREIRQIQTFSHKNNVEYIWRKFEQAYKAHDYSAAYDLMCDRYQAKHDKNSFINGPWIKHDGMGDHCIGINNPTIFYVTNIQLSKGRIAALATTPLTLPPGLESDYFARRIYFSRNKNGSWGIDGRYELIDVEGTRALKVSWP